MATESWARHVIWWHVYPLGFLGAEREGDPGAEPVHRLPRLERWLDHLVALGANGLALGPVFASGTHGYDTVDHFRVDPRLGTEDDLVRLVEACHERGVRVQLDGVFNHVGRGFPRFRDVLEHGPEHPSARWFRIGGEGPDGFGYANFEGHDALVALNHAEPAVADHVAEVMRYWCERGVDSWRLDAAYAVPAGFWPPVLERVRAARPDVWVSAEMIHGEWARYVEESGVDSVTQYELWKAIWSSLNDRNLFELAHALTRHDELLGTFLPQTFVGNHDVTRIASRLSDPGLLGHALAVLFAVPGVPSVYAGDELGMTGVKEDREGGDDAIRPAFPDDPAELPGGDTFATHQELIGVRRRNAWVNDPAARLGEPLALSNTLLALEVTAPEGRLLLALNLDDADAEVDGHVVPGRGFLVEPRG